MASDKPGHGLGRVGIMGVEIEVVREVSDEVVAAFRRLLVDGR
jgi:hypothetical protein